MKHIILTYSIAFLPVLGFSQNKKQFISEFGKTYEVSKPDFKTDLQHELKAVFDVGRSFPDSTKVNPLIHTAARYLNMHIKAGVSFDKLSVALVIHGAAANDILNDIKYKNIYGIDNPNTPLITALSEKGVQIILCGQTAAHRNISRQDIHPEIKSALSAMTALVQLQNENYRLINF